MANWEKLEAEFDSLIENLSSEDWENWRIYREQNKILRRASMQLKVQLHLSRIMFHQQKGDTVFFVENEERVQVLDNETTKISISNIEDFNYK